MQRATVFCHNVWWVLFTIFNLSVKINFHLNLARRRTGVKIGADAEPRPAVPRTYSKGSSVFDKTGRGVIHFIDLE